MTLLTEEKHDRDEKEKGAWHLPSARMPAVKSACRNCAEHATPRPQQFFAAKASSAKTRDDVEDAAILRKTWYIYSPMKRSESTET